MRGQAWLATLVTGISAAALLVFTGAPTALIHGATGAVIPVAWLPVSGSNFNPDPSTSTPSPTTAAGIQCGVERWAVKTLSDSAASSVNFTPQATTVDALRNLSIPDVGSNTPRIVGIETTTYQVQASLMTWKLEDDRDIHLVIADSADSRKTMIVELPEVACDGAATSLKKGEMQSAREVLTTACGNPSSSSFRSLTGSATITGVGFVDEIHGQTGVAPNGIELHPVLSISVSGCSSGIPVPTATPSTATATRTPTTGPTSTPTPTATLTTGPVTGVQFVSVQGAAPGGTASVSVKTFANTLCSIEYYTPAGNKSTASGLVNKTSDASGNVPWSWTIGSNTTKGTGTVTVTCGSATATANITIG